MAILDEVLELNQKASPAADTSRPASVEAKRKFCVITCVDPRLVRFFSSCLGLDRGDAVIIRLPGAVLTTGHADALRAVAAAVYINGATEFLVMGHTDCGTTRIDASAVTSEMQRRGVRPDAMPGGVREFLGAVGDLRSTLKASAAAVRGAPFLPRDLLVHVGILDIVTGGLEVVERGEPYLGQAVAQASSDALSYTPGPSALDLSALLGGGSTLLQPSVHSIFSDESALASSQTPFAFAGLDTSALPPGWSEGGKSLTSAALPDVSTSAAASPEVTSNSIGFASTSQKVEFTTAASVDARPSRRPPLAPPPAPPPRPPKAKKNKARLQTVEVANPASPLPRGSSSNIDKVREFYRLEFTLDQRKTIARSLAEALNQGLGSDQLLKIAIKPVLESGQKRYKVLDELIATKTLVEKMSPSDAYDVLSQLIS